MFGKASRRNAINHRVLKAMSLNAADVEVGDSDFFPESKPPWLHYGASQRGSANQKRFLKSTAIGSLSGLNL
jgi:hypothetical protein